MKNCKVVKTNGLNKFCSHNKVCSGTLCIPKEETLDNLMALRSEVTS